MDTACLVSAVQAGGGGVTLWGRFVLLHHSIISYMPYLIRLLLLLLLQTFQHDHAPCHITKVISNCLNEHDDQFSVFPGTVCKSNSMPLGCRPNRRFVKSVPEKNLQELHDAATRARILKESCRHLGHIEAVLRAN